MGGAKGVKGLLKKINPFKKNKLKQSQKKEVNVSTEVPKKNPYVLNTSTFLTPPEATEYKTVYPKISKRPLPTIPTKPPREREVSNTRQFKYVPEVYNKLSTKSKEGRISNKNGFSKLSNKNRENNPTVRLSRLLNQEQVKLELAQKKKEFQEAEIPEARNI